MTFNSYWLKISNPSIQPSGMDYSGSRMNNDGRKRLSIQSLDERHPSEILLFGLVSGKNSKEIKFLLSQRDFNEKISISINSRDREGHDLLSRAVLTDDISILKQVLAIDPENIDTRHGLLTAAKHGRLTMLIEILFFNDQWNKGTWYAVSKRLLAESKGKQVEPLKKSLLNEGEFGDYQTPLMVAAINGQYDAIQLLYRRGERLPTLHMPRCACKLCKKETRDLERTLKRIHLLRAMASPHYMICMAEQDGNYDPIYESFLLSKAIRKCIEHEFEFKNDYEALLSTVKKFPIDMINLCRTMEETKIFLSQRKGFFGGDHPYPRLGLAIDFTLKEFVSNMNIEFLMENEFAGYAWNPKSELEHLGKSVAVILMLVGYPIMNIFMWSFMCCSKSTRFVKYLLSPLTRCWSKLAAQIYFCALLMFLNTADRVAGSVPLYQLGARMLVIIFIKSHTTSLVRQFLLDTRHFFQRGWNLFDLVTILLHWSSLGIWFWNYRYHFEEITAPRYTIPSDDLCLIGECIFAIASTMSTLRLLRWIILYPAVGPLQTAIGRMAINLRTILVFFMWSTVVFAIGTRILYRPYQHLNKRGKRQPNTLTDPTVHLQVFFKLSKIGPKTTDLLTPVGHVVDPVTGEDKEVENPEYTTQMFITIIVIIFNIVAVSFLRNSVTGLFGSTGRAVLNAKHIEWRYLRVQDWLYYLQDTTLAPPFNMFPNWGCVSYWGSKIKPDVETSSHEKEVQEQYPHLLQLLFQRYFQTTWVKRKKGK